MAGTRHSKKMQSARVREAQYIASLVKELAELARDNQFTMLAQMLELAATHAGNIAETQQSGSKTLAA